jgi:hypothetical protein
VSLSGVGVAGHVVSDDTLAPSRRRGCESGKSDAGPEEWGGGTRSDWLGLAGAPYTPRSALGSAPGH